MVEPRILQNAKPHKNNALTKTQANLSSPYCGGGTLPAYERSADHLLYGVPHLVLAVALAPVPAA